ncbi:hypothetical protein EK904_002073, partial [Melospiza melodia maxima]
EALIAQTVQDLEKQFYLAHSETAEAQTGSTQNSKLRTRVISQTRNTGHGSPMQSVKDEKEARICEMEAKLNKLELEKVQLASLQFAECQCIVQCQEQEAMQAAAHLGCESECLPGKCGPSLSFICFGELQGPGYSSASASGKLQHSVPWSHLLSAVWPHALHLPSSAP